MTPNPKQPATNCRCTELRSVVEVTMGTVAVKEFWESGLFPSDFSFSVDNISRIWFKASRRD